MKRKTKIMILCILILTLLLIETFDVNAWLFSDRRRRKNPPQPPPPPCTTKKAGCYNTQDKKFNFGDLTPIDFAYFHPEESCIRTGGCDCRGFPEDIAEQTNADDSASACSCIIGAQYETKADIGQRCCGDDSTDCGMISKNVFLCSIDIEGQAMWTSSSSAAAASDSVKYAQCTNAEYLTDGRIWTKCDGTFWRKTTGNNEFMCIGRGQKSIVECCGDGNCKSRNGIPTGQSINPADFENEAQATVASNPMGICVATNPAQRSSCGSGSTDSNCVCTSSATKKERFEVCTEVTDSNSAGIINPTGDAGTPGVSGTAASGIGGMSDVEVIYVDSLITGKVTQCTPKFKCTETQGLPCGGQDNIQCPSGSFCLSNTPTGSVIKNIITGKSISSGENKTYYCRSDDGKFVNNLDTPDSQIGDTVLNSKNEKTCRAAGFAWTGTKCCSEVDDLNEYYNDPDGSGGCWNKKPVLSVSFVDGTDNSIVNFNGEFHGCAIDKNNFNINNDNLLELLDKHTGEPLITNHNYCFNDPDNSFYCSFTEKWLPTEDADKSHLSFAPIQNSKQKANCCAQDECWNGEICTANQRNSPLSQPSNGFRCIDGDWVQSSTKSTPDNSANGFCPRDSQCLLNAFGKNASTQCVEDGNYIEDNYCEKGNWSSRTKLLALKLLELKSGGDYTLFCDNRNNALNNLQFLTGSGELVSNVLEGLQTNNFCVLKTGNKLIVATSINKNTDDISRSTLSVLGITNCNDALIDDNQFHSCDSSNKVWLNKVQKSFIYSAKEITIQSNQGLLSSFDRFLGNPIRNLIDSIKSLIKNPPDNSFYLKGLKKFDRLYIVQEGSKSIRGAIESESRYPFSKNAVIEYSGFDIDICKFVDKFNEVNRRNDLFSGVSCKKEGGTYYVLAQGSQFSNINPDLIWLDLTSKLRLK